jgi:hypothetical protein
MSLAPGMRIGPHEILAQIGVGGMAEVYPTAASHAPPSRVLQPFFSVSARRAPAGEQERRAGDDAVPTSARRRGAPGEAGRRRSVHPH